MINVILLILLAMVQGFFWLQFTGYFLTERYKAGKMWLTVLPVIFSTMGGMLLILEGKTIAPIWIVSGIIFVAYLLSAIWAYTNRLIEILLYSVLARMLVLIMNIASSLLAEHIIKVNITEKILVVLLGNAILLALIGGLKRLHPRQPNLKRDDIYYVVPQFVLCAIAFEVWHCQMLTGQIELPHNWILYIVLIALSILEYGAVMVKSVEDSTEQQKIDMLELEQTWKADIEQETKKLRILRHDMKNHISILKLFVDNEQTEELKEYINEMFEETTAANDIVVMENTTLASLISRKKQLAKEKKIQFDSQVLTELPLEDMEMSTLFGNLLDNAIEAAMQVTDHAYIDLKIEKNSKKVYVITCSNSYAVEPKRSADRLLTTKEDSDSHGMGIQSMKRVVEKHNGVLDVTFENAVFTMTILIPE